ncbi:MAG: hypothetical protein ACD_41C00372G0009 [uncultured bacterium]|nr:MAG: hypothetical protein ACD_41C00372G0009 [uncultured bacterium]
MSYSKSSTVPIEMLPGIGRRTAQVLRTMHVYTVGQFKTLPPALLVEVFGPSIRQVHATVRGIRLVRKPKTNLIGMLKFALAESTREFDQAGRSA